jgi:hypothetical protein
MKAKKGGKNKKAGSVDVTFVARQLGNPPKGQEQEAEGDSEEVIKAKRYKALALLKEEDHLWTLEQYAMVVRDTREKNYAVSGPPCLESCPKHILEFLTLLKNF